MTMKRWKMLTWANGDGTGEVTIKWYVSRSSAIRAADKLRAKKIVAVVEKSN